MSSVEARQCDHRALRVAQAVQKSTGVEQVLLFGSRARGDYHEDSDIDLLLVHPDDRAVRAACHQTAALAIQRWYEDPVTMDIVLVSPDLFASVQFGLNHIAAQAARDGVTPMGHPYDPPHGKRPPQDPIRLEAMERAFHASWKFENLKGLMLEGAKERYSSEERYEMAFGEAVQGTLELALKALLTAWREPYGRHHQLERLAYHAQQTVHHFKGLQSPLPTLTAFAGGDIYGSPDLDHDVEELFALVKADLEYIFTLVQQQASFNPWTVRKNDYKF